MRARPLLTGRRGAAEGVIARPTSTAAAGCLGGVVDVHGRSLPGTLEERGLFKFGKERETASGSPGPASFPSVPALSIVGGREGAHTAV